MTKIFIDTEFTDITIDGKLISIALMNEAGDGFYAELTDTWRLADASEFVRETVLPLLDRKESVEMTKRVCAERVGRWLAGKGDVIDLVMDSNFDWQYFLDLVQDKAQAINNEAIFLYSERTIRVNRELLHFADGTMRYIYDNILEEYFEEHGDRQHHAYVDVQGMQEAYLAATRSIRIE